MKKNILLISLTCLFILLLTATAYVSFSGNIETQELTIKSITPVYDETSGVIVTQDNVTFNDKNQVVDYKVVVENTQNYDVKINNISLTTPTEEFLSFQVEEIEDEVLKANSTKEIIVSFETMGIEGWGRNFSDELTANISFEKVSKQEEVVPPKEEETPKEDDKPVQEEVPNEETPEQEKPSKPSEGGQSSKPTPQPEAPVKDDKELIKKIEKLEEVVVTTNTIELPKEIKVSVSEKIAVWIYSEPIFLGYFDVVVENGVKKIEGLEEAISKADIKAGDHNIVLVSNEETLGYIPVSINENKELVIEDNNKKDEAIENPYTNDNILLITLITATSLTGLSIVILSQRKAPKYIVFAIVLGSTLLPTNAEDSIELPLTFNIKFESQNVMKASGCSYDQSSDALIGCVDYWQYRKQLKNFYIQNEITEIKDVIFEFDVTQSDNGRVNAYLVKNKENSNYYDLYLQADGIIYANADSNHYFSEMENIDKIVNLKGIDTSQVTSMREFFYHTGSNSENFTLDVSSLNTSNVTNMKHMFTCVGYNSTNFDLDVSNFDTSNVTDMSSMFDNAGYSSLNFTLDVSGFDTSNVTTMYGMFNLTGYNSTKFDLDVSNFDTSKVVRIARMFYRTGFNSTKLNTSITISNPNISDYANMFYETTTKSGSQIKVNYTAETEELVKQMIATKSENSNVVLGNLIVDVDNLSIGDEIHISGEKFNVISQNADTVTMLAQYNLGNDYKQSKDDNGVHFSDNVGWENKPGSEIDIQVWSTNPKTYINAYIDYLKEQLSNNVITGDLIKLSELGKLGCKIPYDYAPGSYEWICTNSDYSEWLVNGQDTWTSSASSEYAYTIWILNEDGEVYDDYHSTGIRGIRPTITISKETLKGLNS